jgi:phage gp36-like protein
MYAQPFDNTLICQSFKSCELILNGTFVFPFIKMMARLLFEICCDIAAFWQRDNCKGASA